MSNQTVHAVLSASASHRWLSCPGSVQLSAGQPRIGSVYAAEGTAAHDLASRCLLTFKQAEDFLGTSIRVDNQTFEVDENMVDAVQTYLDVVREDLLKAGPQADLMVEHKFHLDHLYDGLFGTNDALISQPFGTLQVYDYKHGKGVAVEVTDNPQLMYYALGAMKEGIYEEVELIIVQPRAAHPDGVVRRQMMSIKELVRWGDEVLVPGVKATENPQAPLHPGDHCKFCPALAVCPAQRERAMDIAREVFSPVPQPPREPVSIPPKELRRILAASGVIESWLNACREHVKFLLESGQVTPEEIGYKIVTGRASRAWIYPERVESFLSSMDIDPFTHKLKSPARAEKELGTKEAKAALEDLVLTSRGTQLAPLSDSREPMSPAIAVFGEVDVD